jgi:sugar O-acyltransferase (sialic acid O-acetyltransferase NeuD family)
MSALLIIGAGGFARETAELVRSCGSQWDLLGFLDDDLALRGEVRCGVPVLGDTTLVSAHPHARVVVCLGSPADYFSRRRVVERLELPAERFATLVHPSATVAASAQVGPGSVVHAGCVLTADIAIGAHVAVMPHVVLTHDDVVDDYVSFGAGVLVAGGVRIDSGAYVGAGARIRENLVIGSWSMIGMGAVVTRNVPSGEVWAGVPARRRGSVQVPREWVR